MEHHATAAAGYAASPANGAGNNEDFSSGVSWAAVIGGAFVAAALSVILLALGAGLGLSSVSPWAHTGASASTMGIATILWLIGMQVVASGMGGYLAGRLRTKWVNVHTDEVFFRDTAHGFLVWAVGLVISASFLASAATSIMGGAVQAGTAGLSIGGAAALAAPASGIRPDERSPDTNAYYVDALFRAETPPAADNDPSVRSEVGRILAKGLGQAEFSAADKSYVAKRVAARTGLTQADAEKRVADTIAQAKKAEADARQAADEARKTAAHGLLWIFVSLLTGAFCASYAATIGGRQRDHVVA
jgi:hypothetical protein